MVRFHKSSTKPKRVLNLLKERSGDLNYSILRHSTTPTKIYVNKAGMVVPRYMSVLRNWKLLFTITLLVEMSP